MCAFRLALCVSASTGCAASALRGAPAEITRPERRDADAGRADDAHDAAVDASDGARTQAAAEPRWERATSPPCDVVNRRNDAAHGGSAGRGAIAQLVQCYTTPGGAWAFVLDPVQDDLSRLMLTLAHFDRSGREVVADWPFGRSGVTPRDYDDPNYSNPDESWREVSLPTVFDFDGDGEPEFGFSQTDRNRHGESNGLTVYRYARGRVTWLPTPRGAEWLQDVDGDGRPDAVIPHEDYEELDCGNDWGWGEAVEAPQTIARSLPGGRFAMNDLVALVHNRNACGPRPLRIVERALDGHVDDETTARNVVCAGAWGVPRVQLEAALRGCRAYQRRVNCDDETTRAWRQNECRHRGILLRWAAAFP